MAALANPPEAKYSYIDPLSFMFSRKPEFLDKQILLPQEFDFNPSFVYEKKLFRLEPSFFYFWRKMQPGD